MSFQTKAPIVDWSTRLAFLDIKNMGLRLTYQKHICYPKHTNQIGSNLGTKINREDHFQGYLATNPAE